MTFPTAPLEQLMGNPSPAALTRLWRCPLDAVTTARAWGWSWEQADRYATRAGFHPAEVWHELWWSAARTDGTADQWQDGAA